MKKLTTIVDTGDAYLQMQFVRKTVNNEASYFRGDSFHALSREE